MCFTSVFPKDGLMGKILFNNTGNFFLVYSRMWFSWLWWVFNTVPGLGQRHGHFISNSILWESYFVWATPGTVSPVLSEVWSLSESSLTFSISSRYKPHCYTQDTAQIIRQASEITGLVQTSLPELCIRSVTSERVPIGPLSHLPSLHSLGQLLWHNNWPSILNIWQCVKMCWQKSQIYIYVLESKR